VSATRMPGGGVKWVGLDVARDAIAVGVLDGPSGSASRMEKVAHDEVSIRRLVTRLGEPSRPRVCYEAGRTGYELYRLLMSMRVACEVIAPSLVPVAGGEKVKTDRRDARRLVRLYRAGELVTVGVPTHKEEGCRDLCRLRGAAVFDRSRARQRLASFRLRRHLVYREGTTWTLKHRRWLRSLSFDDAGAHATFAHLLASVEEREVRVSAIEADLAGFFERDLFVDQPQTDAEAAPPDLTAREQDVLVALCRPLLARDMFTEPASTRTIADENSSSPTPPSNNTSPTSSTNSPSAPTTPTAASNSPTAPSAAGQSPSPTSAATRPRKAAAPCA
jgi:Transposase